MAVTAPVALTEASAVQGPNGPSLTEQNLSTANGNKFVNDPGKRLYVRNTTAGLIGIDFFADKYGNEVKLVDGSLAANQVPANGVRIFGPFDPALFNDHSTNVAAANGSVVCKQQSGSAGQLVACPLPAAG